MSQRGPDLPEVRRFEAAGFRAWPATSVRYDGTWVIRLTEGHPSKRLNSVSLLDPGDLNDLEARIERAGRCFASYGRPLIFRISPLAGTAIPAHLDQRGWRRFGESIVMRLDLASADLDHVIDQIPMKDVARFVAAAASVRADEPVRRPGLADIVTAIPAEAGLFVQESEGMAIATAICVHDGDLAGLFEIIVRSGWRHRGHGRSIVQAALKWAHLRGASTAWLQVEADNEAAVSLYRSLGFTEVYRYHYRSPAEEAA